jgi:hypothetical protein
VALVGLDRDIDRLPRGYASELGKGVAETLPPGLLKRTTGRKSRANTNCRHDAGERSVAVRGSVPHDYPSSVSADAAGGVRRQRGGDAVDAARARRDAA